MYATSIYLTPIALPCPKVRSCHWSLWKGKWSAVVEKSQYRSSAAKLKRSWTWKLHDANLAREKKVHTSWFPPDMADFRKVRDALTQEILELM
jgi:hypothetical protein